MYKRVQSTDELYLSSPILINEPSETHQLSSIRLGDPFVAFEDVERDSTAKASWESFVIPFWYLVLNVTIWFQQYGCTDVSSLIPHDWSLDWWPTSLWLYTPNVTGKCAAQDKTYGSHSCSSYPTITSTLQNPVMFCGIKHLQLQTPQLFTVIFTERPRTTRAMFRRYNW